MRLFTGTGYRSILIRPAYVLSCVAVSLYVAFEALDLNDLLATMLWSEPAAAEECVDPADRHPAAVPPHLSPVDLRTRLHLSLSQFTLMGSRLRVQVAMVQWPWRLPAPRSAPAPLDPL